MVAVCNFFNNRYSFAAMLFMRYFIQVPAYIKMSFPMCSCVCQMPLKFMPAVCMLKKCMRVFSAVMETYFNSMYMRCLHKKDKLTNNHDYTNFDSSGLIFPPPPWNSLWAGWRTGLPCLESTQPPGQKAFPPASEMHFPHVMKCLWQTGLAQLT